MQRSISISLFILLFIPSFAGINEGITQKIFKLFSNVKNKIILGSSEISSGLFNSNHSQYLKDAVYQRYLEMKESKNCVFFFGQLLINH
jgi:hypothetical protein